MKSNIVKDFVAPIGVLLIICLVISTILVGAYNITLPIIEQQKIEAANKARAEVLPEGNGFEKIEATLPEGVRDIYKATNDSGYVITAEARGYGGPVVVMVGIKADGTISKAKLLENNETPGLGTKVGEPAYTSQYEGKDSKMEGVNAIGGATISSKAFSKAMTNAFEIYGTVAGVDVSGKPEREPVSEDMLKKVAPTATAFTRLEQPGEMYKAEGAGYVYVGDGDGFMDMIVAAIAMDDNGSITAIKFVQNNESDDYGKKLQNASYLEKYIGKKKGDTLDSISGSTISSTAFNKIVTQALEAYEAAKGV